MKMIVKYKFCIPAFLLIIGSFISSCYYDKMDELYGNISCDTVAMTYSADILPILEGTCLTCHNSTSSGALGGGNNLEGFDNLSDFITPGDPENSTLYASMAWIPGTVFMPQGGNKLSDCAIAKVQSWIINGAQNN